MSWKYSWAPTNLLGLQTWPPSHTQLQFVSTFLGWWLVIWSWQKLIVQSHLFAPQKAKSFPSGISRDEQIHVGFCVWMTVYHLESMKALPCQSGSVSYSCRNPNCILGFFLHLFLQWDFASRQRWPIDQVPLQFRISL